MVSYCTVAHMGMAIGGYYNVQLLRGCGYFALMVAHGLCSLGLFCPNYFY
jgi:NADH-ubiquinone oxidoreductase chain 4